MLPGVPSRSIAEGASKCSLTCRRGHARNPAVAPAAGRAGKAGTGRRAAGGRRAERAAGRCPVALSDAYRPDNGRPAELTPAGPAEDRPPSRRTDAERPGKRSRRRAEASAVTAALAAGPGRSVRRQAAPRSHRIPLRIRRDFAGSGRSQHPPYGGADYVNPNPLARVTGEIDRILLTVTTTTRTHDRFGRIAAVPTRRGGPAPWSGQRPASVVPVSSRDLRSLSTQAQPPPPGSSCGEPATMVAVAGAPVSSWVMVRRQTPGWPFDSSIR
jgi:hypothetical protein